MPAICMKTILEMVVVRLIDAAFGVYLWIHGMPFDWRTREQEGK